MCVIITQKNVNFNTRHEMQSAFPVGYNACQNKNRSIFPSWAFLWQLWQRVIMLSDAEAPLSEAYSKMWCPSGLSVLPHTWHSWLSLDLAVFLACTSAYGLFLLIAFTSSYRRAFLRLKTGARSPAKDDSGGASLSESEMRAESWSSLLSRMWYG